MINIERDIVASSRVSVVIPLYNKADTIERAIVSVLGQTYQDFEIIVIDDGSTDNGADIVRRYVDVFFPQIKIIKQNNLGPGAARNCGVAESNAEFIAFLDGDDELLPGFLEHCIFLFDSLRNVSAVVPGCYEGIDKHNAFNDWKNKGLHTGIYSLTSATSAESVITILTYMKSWTMVRRDAILKYGGFYEHKCVYAEDSYLWLKFLFNTDIYIELKPLVWWHSESSNLSRNLKGVRPIEPFFTDLSCHTSLLEACPQSKLLLLKEFLALRASKTAAVLGFWGQWQKGREIFNQYSSLSYYHSPIVLIGYIAATPLGTAMGSLIRTLMKFAPKGSRLGF